MRAVYFRRAWVIVPILAAAFAALWIARAGTSLADPIPAAERPAVMTVPF